MDSLERGLFHNIVIGALFLWILSQGVNPILPAIGFLLFVYLIAALVLLEGNEVMERLNLILGKVCTFSLILMFVVIGAFYHLDPFFIFGCILLGSGMMYFYPYAARARLVGEDVKSRAAEAAWVLYIGLFMLEIEILIYLLAPTTSSTLYSTLTLLPVGLGVLLVCWRVVYHQGFADHLLPPVGTIAMALGLIGLTPTVDFLYPFQILLERAPVLSIFLLIFGGTFLASSAFLRLLDTPPRISGKAGIAH
jgi:hypothetical protein